MSNKIREKIKEYHFEFKHITVLFIILFAFQLIVSFVNKASIKDFITTTQDWYLKESAEEIANLTATAIELVLESVDNNKTRSIEERKRIEQSFDIIFSQQQLAHNIEKLGLLIKKSNKYILIDDGKTLYDVLIEQNDPKEDLHTDPKIVDLYHQVETDVKLNEQIKSIRDRKNFSHICSICTSW